MSPYAIERVTSKNFESVWPLICDCLNSYGLERFNISEYRAFFLQFTRSNRRGVQHLCHLDQTPIGFSTVYFTFSTFYGGRVAYLNDLFVASEFRGRGAGRALLDNVRVTARSRGIEVVQWLVREDNHRAQQFYRPLDTVRSHWMRYSWRV